MTLALAGDTAYAVLLASVRVVAWLIVAPPFSSRTVPMTVKVVLGFSLASAAWPMLGETRLPTGVVEMLATVVVQVGVGAAMGFLTSLLFAAITAAGSIIDLLGGFSIAQAFDPMTSSSTTVVGNLHQMLADSVGAAAVVDARGGLTGIVDIDSVMAAIARMRAESRLASRSTDRPRAGNR